MFEENEMERLNKVGMTKIREGKSIRQILARKGGKMKRKWIKERKKEIEVYDINLFLALCLK